MLQSDRPSRTLQIVGRIEMNGDPRTLSALTRLRGCRSVVVALSGGVDSAVLLALALEALGRERVLAVTGSSPSVTAEDLAAARAVAGHLKAEHLVVPTCELDLPGYRANRGDRCFHCRSELFGLLRRVADERGLARVVYGAIADDLGDHRPGMRAAERMGVVAPLLEAGLGKREIRALARAAALPIAERPANACLASRIPAGSEVTVARLQRIGRAEAALRALGLGQLRVRDHGKTARLELDADGLRRIGDDRFRGRALRAVREAGFEALLVDPAGYRPGGAGSIAPSREGGQ
jgi:uncharacterized protein